MPVCFAALGPIQINRGEDCQKLTEPFTALPISARFADTKAAGQRFAWGEGWGPCYRLQGGSHLPQIPLLPCPKRNISRGHQGWRSQPVPGGCSRRKAGRSSGQEETGDGVPGPYQTACFHYCPMFSKYQLWRGQGRVEFWDLFGLGIHKQQQTKCPLSAISQETGRKFFSAPDD